MSDALHLRVATHTLCVPWLPGWWIKADRAEPLSPHVFLSVLRTCLKAAGGGIYARCDKLSTFVGRLLQHPQTSISHSHTCQQYKHDGHTANSFDKLSISRHSLASLTCVTHCCALASFENQYWWLYSLTITARNLYSSLYRSPPRSNHRVDPFIAVKHRWSHADGSPSGNHFGQAALACLSRHQGMYRQNTVWHTIASYICTHHSVNTLLPSHCQTTTFR